MKNKLMMIAVLLAVAAGCKKEANGPNTITAGSNGRNIKVVAYGPVWVNPNSGLLTVTVKDHVFVFEKDRLLVDKTEAAKFPATATDFAVAYSNGALNVTADGAAVLTTTLAK